MVVKLFLVALPVFFAIDMVWLGFVARSFYRDHLGSLLRTDVNWPAAVIFYLIFIVGLTIFVIDPAVASGSWTEAVWRGALFGIITYATYDLTNLATLRDWSLLVTAVDLAWGMVLAASVAGITYWIASRLGW